MVAFERRQGHERRVGSNFLGARELVSSLMRAMRVKREARRREGDSNSSCSFCSKIRPGISFQVDKGVDNTTCMHPTPPWTRRETTA